MKAHHFEALRESIAAERLVAVATVIRGEGVGRQLLLWPDGERLGDLGGGLDAAAVELAGELMRSFRPGRRTVETDGGGAEVFVEVHPPRKKLVIIGAVHVAIPLVHLAKRLGYRTVVVDPRSAFATEERFAHADELRVERPDPALVDIGLDEASFVVALSHNLEIDVPALVYALARPVRYVGALGSRRTHEKRTAALREAGVDDEAIGRIHAPIGLDLGGRQAEEIALSIVAQMQAVHSGRSL